MLLSWDAANQENGLEAADIQVYSGAEYVLALEFGQFDLYFGPAPSSAIARPTMWVVPVSPLLAVLAAISVSTSPAPGTVTGRQFSGRTPHEAGQ